MKNDPIIIDIEEDNREDTRPVYPPTFSMEVDDIPEDEGMPLKNIPKSPQKPWRLILIIVAIIVVGGIGLFFISKLPDNTESGILSRDQENIEMLKETPSTFAHATTVSSDSVLGVAFDVYSLKGLRASLESNLPDTTDQSVILMMRSVDYRPDNSWIGDVVLNGKKFEDSPLNKRTGYIAISATGNPIIGTTQSEEVKNYIENSEGSYFQQYPLVVNGELPSKFALRGKVERAAIGRKPDGELNYIVTCHPESMYDFADALREYGYMDAIYLTGGNNYTLYRDTTGRLYVPTKAQEKYKKYKEDGVPAPLLVFRARARED